MSIVNKADQHVLDLWGERVARHRLNQSITQEQLANEAGVSLPTLKRMESGTSTNVINLIRVLRALGLSQNFDLLIPEPPESPMEKLKYKGEIRRRASSKRKEKIQEQEWRWGDNT